MSIFRLINIFSTSTPKEKQQEKMIAQKQPMKMLQNTKSNYIIYYELHFIIQNWMSRCEKSYLPGELFNIVI